MSKVLVISNQRIRIYMILALLAAVVCVAVAIATNPSPATAGPGTVAPRAHDFIYWGNPAGDIGRWVVEYNDENGNKVNIPLYTAQRRSTGVDGSLPFLSGERVVALKIVYDNGRTYRDCWLDTSMNGTATNGVVNPWQKEKDGLPPCPKPW